MKNIKYIFIILATLTITGCGVYSFTGTSIASNIETFQVNRFENNSLLVEPGLANTFKISLEDYIQNQTNLSLTTSNGDLVYEGEITNYRISPTTATSDDVAAQNRLTISVNLRFFNRKNEEDDLEQSFSFYYDYDGTSQLTGTLKTTAHEEIFERLTSDIFNATLAKW